MSEHTGFVDKYNALKQAFLNTKMVKEVKLVYSEEHAIEEVKNTKFRTVYVVPSDAAIFTNNDYVKFDIIIADKVNNDDNEEYMLQSWSNALSILRAAVSELNYKVNESVVVEDIDVGSYFSDEDTDRVNAVSIVITTLDLEYDIIPKIKHD